MKRKHVLSGAFAAAVLVAAVGGAWGYGAQQVPQQAAAADFSPLPYSYEELEAMSGEDLVAALTPLAETGRVRAMTRLGWAYVQRRNGLICDWGEVKKWFCRAADLGDEEALSTIATEMEFFDCDPDGKYFRQWLAVTETAAQNGDADAMWELAVAYDVARGHTRAQHDRAAYWRRKAVEAGQKEAVKAHLRDRVEACLSKDVPDADDIRCLRQALALENSNITAVAEGICYEKGIDRPADIAKAVQCYAEANHSAAKRHLAAMYEEGRGVEQDLEKALELYDESVSSLSNARCAERLRMRKAGQGAEEAAIMAACEHNPYVAERESLEERLETPPASADEARAAYNTLAEMYALGRGGNVDLEEALRLNTLAEKLPAGGHSTPAAPAIPAGEVPPHAVCRLLNDILTGETELLPQHLSETEQRQFTARCRREALLGCADAQYKLSLAYRTGYGDVPADEEMADRWLSAAVSADFLPALVEEATKKDESNILEYAMAALYGQEDAMRALQVFMQGQDADFTTDSAARHAYFFALADPERGDWYPELYCLRKHPQGVNAALPGGTTPLRLAFRFGREGRITALMAAGAALPTEQAWLDAELCRAVRLGRTEAAWVLAAAGADTHQMQPDSQGTMRPLCELAAEKGDAAIVQILQQADRAAGQTPPAERAAGVPAPDMQTWLAEELAAMGDSAVQALAAVQDARTADAAAESVETAVQRLRVWLQFAEAEARAAGEWQQFRSRMVAVPALQQFQRQIMRCRKASCFGSARLQGVLKTADRESRNKPCSLFEISHTVCACHAATQAIASLHAVAAPAGQHRAYELALRTLVTQVLNDLCLLNSYAEPADAEEEEEVEKYAAKIQESAAQTARACLPLWKTAEGDAWGSIIKALAPLVPQVKSNLNRMSQE